MAQIEVEEMDTNKFAPTTNKGQKIDGFLSDKTPLFVFNMYLYDKYRFGDF